MPPRCGRWLQSIKPCAAVTKQRAPRSATCTGCRRRHTQLRLAILPALQEDPELKPLFEKAQKGGMQAVMALMNDQQFLQKIGEKMGDIPEVAAPAGAGPAAAGPAAAAPEVNNLLDAAK